MVRTSVRDEAVPDIAGTPLDGSARQQLPVGREHDTAARASTRTSDLESCTWEPGATSHGGQAPNYLNSVDQLRSR